MTFKIKFMDKIYTKFNYRHKSISNLILITLAQLFRKSQDMGHVYKNW